MSRLNKLLDDNRLPVFIPFLKEWIFGDSDIAKVIRRNKTTTILVIINILLLGLFFYMSNQAFDKHKEVMEKNKQITQLQDQIKKIDAIDGLDITDPSKFASQILQMDQNLRQCRIANEFLQKRIDEQSKANMNQYFNQIEKNCK